MATQGRHKAQPLQVRQLFMTQMALGTRRSVVLVANTPKAE